MSVQEPDDQDIEPKRDWTFYLVNVIVLAMGTAFTGGILLAILTWDPRWLIATLVTGIIFMAG